MNFTELLTKEIDDAYRATEGMLDLVEEGTLDWKPQTNHNWMNTGQLLKHLTNACGFCCRGFVTNDWGMPEGVAMEDLPPEEMMPPAEKMETIESVAQAKVMLAEDKAMALEMIKTVGEDGLCNKLAVAPWAPDAKLPLGQHFLSMVSHLNLHKAQLFYYLKLQGKPVHTGTLWGA